jgi:hypothetical protein
MPITQTAEEEERKWQMRLSTMEKEKLSIGNGTIDENVQGKPSHAEL